MDVRTGFIFRNASKEVPQVAGPGTKYDGIASLYIWPPESIICAVG